MALIHCDFVSESLRMSTSMNVILPQPSSARLADADSGSGTVSSNTRHPTLYLLHGLSDDHTAWVRRTCIERYAAPLGLAVVMPRVDRSWYTDMQRGLRYWTFISEELPALCQSLFPLSDRREDTFVAGLSMGGYGAFKLALSHPHRFAAAASLSGAIAPAHYIADAADPDRRRELENIFGDLQGFHGSDHDPIALADRLVGRDHPRPALYACCGDQDFLLDQSRAFRDHARALGLDLTYEEDPGYAHTWDYWELAIQRVLRWLPLPPKEVVHG